MGYLSNNGTITVDAILTKKGRELLAKGEGNFRITQFALADDEIDYDLWNPNHGGGSNYYGVVIENMPITEAVPDETQSMKYKLVSLPKGTLAIPYMQTTDFATSYSFNHTDGQAPLGTNNRGYVLFDVKTYQYTGTPGKYSTPEGQTYSVTILDTTYMDLLVKRNTGTGVLTTSGNSKTISAVPEMDGYLKIRVDGKDKLGQGTKTTKVVITNERYGSRLVVPVTYTWTGRNIPDLTVPEVQNYR